MVVACAALGALCLLRGSGAGFKRLTEKDVCEMDGLVPLHLRRFSLRDVKAATANFAKRQAIGEGESCQVFCGRLEGLGEVAMKRMKRVRHQGGAEGDLKAFLNEVALLSKAAHRHIVPLLGFCVEGGERIMLFPFYSGGSVATHFPGQWVSP